MKKNCTSALILLSGLGALGLREGLYRAAVDSRGLLAPWHPLELGLWALTAMTLLGVLLLVRRGEEPEGLPGWTAALGAAVLAAAVIYAGNGQITGILPVLKTVDRVFSILAGAGLLAAAYFRLRGKTPVFGCHLAAAAFFAVHAVACYQGWSRDPQMMNYVFSLLGCLCMAMFAYQQAAGEIGIGSRRVRLFAGMMGVYCCCAAFCQGGWLYPAGALWMLTGLWERN